MATDINKPKCSYCLYWVDTDEIDDEDKNTLAECRRFPPIFKSTELSGADWPKTFSDEWCGEFKDTS